jgi:hypothetical protein
MKYDEIKAIHFSGLKHMRRSPAHYQHCLKNPIPDSNRMALGRGCHTAVLEPDRLLIDYALFKGESQRRGTNEWKEFAKLHPEETILKLAEYQKIIAIRDAVRAHPEAKKLLASGKAEQTITWVDRLTGLPCKGRVDWLTYAMVDLKSTPDVDEYKFSGVVARMLYHAQAAFYVDGIKESTGKELPAIFIAVEVDPPHDVAVYELDEDTLEAGREEYQTLIRQVAMCRQAKSWPGRYPEKRRLRLPSWSFTDEESDVDITDVVDFGGDAHQEA